MKLYKYRSLDSAWETLDIIVNRRLYLAPLESLNDPMEARTQQARSILESHFRKHAINYHGTLSASDITLAKKLGLDDITNDLTSVGEMSLAIATRPYSRICSLSADSHSVTMWSHYANAHKGICIEVEVGSATPVRYWNTQKLEKYFSADYMARLFDRLGSKAALELAYLHEKLRRLYSTKMNDWSYESEWRILRDERHRYYELKGGECISRILVGPRISSFHHDILCKLAPEGIPVVRTRILDGTVREME